MADVLPIFFIIIVGLVIGSFLNVVIFRLHAGKDFVRGRSECPKCHHQLAWYDNIPVVSYLLLRGKCRNCHKPISIQYPLVELATAGLFTVTYLAQPLHTYADVLVLAMWLYVVASFIVLTIYDLRWYLLPDKVLLPIIIPAAAILIGQAFAAHSLAVAWKPVAAALVFGGGFYALAAVSKGRWMGGGDVKLAFVMGLLLGLQKTALAMLIAFNVAALIGLLLILTGRKKRTDYIPFGPFLIAGTLLAYWVGSVTIHWYLASSGLGLLNQ